MFDNYVSIGLGTVGCLRKTGPVRRQPARADQTGQIDPKPTGSSFVHWISPTFNFAPILQSCIAFLTWTSPTRPIRENGPTRLETINFLTLKFIFHVLEKSKVNPSYNQLAYVVEPSHVIETLTSRHAPTTGKRAESTRNLKFIFTSSFFHVWEFQCKVLWDNVVCVIEVPS